MFCILYISWIIYSALNTTWFNFPLKSCMKSFINLQHLILALISCVSGIISAIVSLRENVSGLDTDSCLVFVLCFSSKPENQSQTSVCVWKRNDSGGQRPFLYTKPLHHSTTIVRNLLCILNKESFFSIFPNQHFSPTCDALYFTILVDIVFMRDAVLLFQTSVTDSLW